MSLTVAEDRLGSPLQGKKNEIETKLPDNLTKKLIKVIFLSGSLSLLLDCNGELKTAEEKTVVDIFMEDPEALGRGQALFEGSCANYCHGKNQTADKEQFLFDCYWKHGGSDQEIFDIVTAGIPETTMIGFGSNFPDGDDDLWKIIAFLRVKQEACI